MPKPNIYSVEEIQIMAQGGYILSRILKYLLKMAQDKKSGDEIEKKAQRLIQEAGGEAAFMEAKNEKNEFYPAAICLSVNDTVVHGIPYGIEIKSGDVVSIDIGLRYKGLITDMAWTVYVDGNDPKIKNLLKVNEEALKSSIKLAKLGCSINDISATIEKNARRHNLTPVIELTGHGVGKILHEDPPIYNIPLEGRGDYSLKEGMVLAIEPIFALNPYKKLQMHNDWGIILNDNITSHFEFTVAVGAQAKILTPDPLS